MFKLAKKYQNLCRTFELILSHSTQDEKQTFRWQVFEGAGSPLR